MNKIWANRLIAGDRFTWADVPASRKVGVLAELKNRVEVGEITAERFTEITGEIYEATN